MQLLSKGGPGISIFRLLVLLFLMQKAMFGPDKTGTLLDNRGLAKQVVLVERGTLICINLCNCDLEAFMTWIKRQSETNTRPAAKTETMGGVTNRSDIHGWGDVVEDTNTPSW